MWTTFRSLHEPVVRNEANILDRLAMTQENRDRPRVPFDGPVALMPAGGGAVLGSAVNLGHEGMRINVDRGATVLLHPGGCGNPPDDAPPVEAHYTLPIGDGEVRVNVACRLVYLKATLQNRVAIGLQFADFKESSRNDLNDFIREALEPSG